MRLDLLFLKCSKRRIGYYPCNTLILIGAKKPNGDCSSTAMIFYGLCKCLANEDINSLFFWKRCMYVSNRYIYVSIALFDAFSSAVLQCKALATNLLCIMRIQCIINEGCVSL